MRRVEEACDAVDAGSGAERMTSWRDGTDDDALRRAGDSDPHVVSPCTTDRLDLNTAPPSRAQRSIGTVMKSLDNSASFSVTADSSDGVAKELGAAAAGCQVSDGTQ